MSIFSKFKKLFDTSEANLSLAVTENDITLTTESAGKESIAWSDLEEISIYSIESSLDMPCFFWHLKGKNQSIDFSDSVKGAKEALHIIYTLDGFNSLLYYEVTKEQYSEPVVVWKRNEKGA